MEGEGRYVKNMDYAHIRTDAESPAYANPSLAESNDPRDSQKMIEAGRAMPQLQKPLSADARHLWEPTFTHRMPFGMFAEWSKINDANGLPKYLSLTRLNKPVTYGEFGKAADFVASTYALGVPALDRLYKLPLRGFLEGLVMRQRENPELLISVEPNHEHEIAVEEDETIGDYNPAMIAGYREYSQQMLGLNEAGVKAHYGLPATQKFDAPRNDNRGAWDVYDEKNPFFLDWSFYNRYVVNRRLADTFTQALLVGFPSELVKSHQIPDTFAIASTKGFSTVRNRITPVDYAMSAGVGFGYTRYGVWKTHFRHRRDRRRCAAHRTFEKPGSRRHF